MTQRRIALVTGAGSGVGRAAAVTLSQNGYDVVISGRRLEPLQETQGMLGGDSLIRQCDVGDPAAVRAMFDAAVAKFGRIDVTFNNAGTGAPPVELDEITDESWLTVVNANLNGVFWCTREAFRVMKKQSPQGGRIINNGSISAHTPRPYSIAYTSTKHAVTGLTKTTALDGRPYDIACSQIDIGNAATPMTARMPQGVPQADLTVKQEPVMDVQHVADAILYMANLPLDANVLNMTVMATKMPFVGRG
ncbi:MAG: SDR family oxidoreductase [Minwuia sp.]|uniref:SDR family oxidoreductase n=1 Tax=Minwuia sp. TaxID=2493630 RepID=UPI003A8B56DA